ncbi:MAG TPA: class I SAM-dependent methyltransferase [Candidatus Coatesbacteria bacterium]|nr:class I SAM-dependent methyltransferase [Candidatus Coatesbacteria bacterium]
MDPIHEHYRAEALECGLSKQSTMRDVFVRDAELKAILGFLARVASAFDSPELLEVGCGNGYTAERIAEALGLCFTAVDFSPEMLELARSRGLQGVRFDEADLRELPYADGSFDAAFTERCLINLTSWEEQRRGLDEIARVLRPGGLCLLIEGVADGLERLNAARSALDLPPIQVPHHNLFLQRTAFLDYVGRRFDVISAPEEENFLSSYYFGSRVLYPALHRGKEVEYNNRFIEFFSLLPAYGEYSYVRQFILRKH